MSVRKTSKTCWCCGGFYDPDEGTPEQACDCHFGTGWHLGERDVGIPPHQVETCETHRTADD